MTTTIQGIFRIINKPYHIDIIDISDAGKRGRSCIEYSLNVYSKDGQKYCDVVHNMQIKLADVKTQHDLRIFLDCAEDLGVEISSRAIMSYRVTPADCEPVGFSNSFVSVSVSYDGFSARDLTDMHNEPRLINTSESSTSANRKFYKCFKQNLDSLTNTTTILDIGEMARSCGVRTHSYCALD